MFKKKIVIGKENDALVIIDAQKDFICNDGALYVAGIEGEENTIGLINGIVSNLCLSKHNKFGYKVATKDKHPNDHIEYVIFGRHCVDGTEGQMFHEVLSPFLLDADEIIEKGQHPAVISYSVATSPQFPEHIVTLRKKGIKRVFVCGWAYTHCVGESSIAYACQGFETYVIRDLTRSVPPPYGDPEKMKKKLVLYGVKEIFLKDIE